MTITRLRFEIEVVLTAGARLRRGTATSTNLNQGEAEPSRSHLRTLAKATDVPPHRNEDTPDSPTPHQVPPASLPDAPLNPVSQSPRVSMLTNRSFGLDETVPQDRSITRSPSVIHGESYDSHSPSPGNNDEQIMEVTRDVESVVVRVLD